MPCAGGGARALSRLPNIVRRRGRRTAIGPQPTRAIPTRGAPPPSGHASEHPCPAIAHSPRVLPGSSRRTHIHDGDQSRWGHINRVCFSRYARCERSCTMNAERGRGAPAIERARGPVVHGDGLHQGWLGHVRCKGGRGGGNLRLMKHSNVKQQERWPLGSKKVRRAGWEWQKSGPSKQERMRISGEGNCDYSSSFWSCTIVRWMCLTALPSSAPMSPPSPSLRHGSMLLVCEPS